MNSVWTFLPGLHGTATLFEPIKKLLTPSIPTEFIELPNKGNQDYEYLSQCVNAQLENTESRILIAESFSGPIALQVAAARPQEITAIVLAASLCETPVNSNLALLPLRPLFMVKPPNAALRHFLIGNDASPEEVSSLRDAIREIPSEILASRVRSILELKEQDNPDLAAIPILMLQAQNDNLLPWETQQQLEAHYPHAEVHWLDSPHLILQTSPKECLDLIQKFIADLRIHQV